MLENWKKVSDDPVCFGAKHNTYGRQFKMSEAGLIYTFKLVHVNGLLFCEQNEAGSYWGCPLQYWYGDKKLLTVITYPNKTALLLADYARDGHLCGYKYHSYHIDGIGVNSSELVFNKLSPPMFVSSGQSFQIWYSEDLSDCGEDENSGQVCAVVYAWYDTY